MNELHIVIAVAAIAVLLMIILIYLIVREIILTKTKITDSLEPAKQPATNILSKESISEAETGKESVRESQTVEPPCSAESDSNLDEKSQTNVTETQKYVNLPQDSMLRRHYLTHLRAMIESLKSPRPTDSALGRHYDAIISAETEQCLTDQESLQRLISNYENHKKIRLQQIEEAPIIAEPLPQTEIIREETATQQEISKVPEDSMLRRHYITQLYAMVESNMPPRPTDSVLRRHYDTMLNAEVNKLLGS